MNEPENIDLSKLWPAPIRHASLPPDLLNQIRAVYGLIGPYLNTTLEQFEIGFMRDLHPESEVAIWCTISAAWHAYHEKHCDGETQPLDVEKKILGALIAISAGVSAPEALNVPADVGIKLLACYDEVGQGGVDPA